MIPTFARFDIINFVTPARRVVPAVLLVLVAPVIAPWPAFAIGAAAIVMSLLAANPFAADEQGRLDTLYSTLPISRRTVVFGRYIALVLIYLVVAMIGTLAAVVTTLAGGHAVDLVTVGAVDVAAFLVFSLALALQMPFFFSVGYTRARPLVFIPAGLLVAGAALASQTGLVDTSDLVGALSRNLASVWIGAPIVAVAALVVSAAISNALYRRRDL